MAAAKPQGEAPAQAGDAELGETSDSLPAGAGDAKRGAGLQADAGQAEAGRAGMAEKPGSPEQMEAPQQMEALRREAAENYDRFLRARAELENVLKRHERERIERVKYAAEPIVRDLLGVVDDLERALDHAVDHSEGLRDGVELVLKGMRAILGKHGVERIEALGRPFDPSEHEAIAMVETSDHSPNTVVDEHRAGYRLRDRLLRPAMVAVAKAPQTTAEEQTAKK